MLGHLAQDRWNVAHSTMPDFGATTLYKEEVSRGSWAMKEQDLVSAPRNTANIYNIDRMMVQRQMPTPKPTPLSRVKSHYTFLPTNQG